MREVLPKNWVKVNIADVLSFTYGKGIPVSELSDSEGYNVYGANGIIGKYPTYMYDSSKIIISCRGAASGAIHKTTPKSTITSNSIILNEIGSNIFDIDFLKNMMLVIDKSSIITGTAQPQITIQQLNKLAILIAPLPEQQRIGNKLNKLFAQIDNVRRATDRIPQLLKNLRQQILTHAVTGKLTNSNSIDAVLKDYLTDVRYGTSKKANYETDGVPVFRIPNISNGKIDDRDLKYVNLESSEFNKLYLKEGDILVIRSNGSVSLLGQCAVVKSKHNNYVYAGYLIRLRCNEKMNADYLSILLRSSYIRGQIIDSSHSTSGVNNINAEQLKSLRILYYSIKEQEAIVEKATALFEQLDNIEERYERLTQKLKDLPQSLLHKAFKGELVPQLPTDGSATDLLREIEALSKTIKKK